MTRDDLRATAVLFGFNAVIKFEQTNKDDAQGIWIDLDADFKLERGVDYAWWIIRKEAESKDHHYARTQKAIVALAQKAARIRNQSGG